MANWRAIPAASPPSGGWRLPRAPLLPVAISLGLSLVFIARTAFAIDGVTYFSLFDDAMVSMRYARNLAQGHGLVWNPGQPPVEGYTNLAWTLWMAVVHWLAVPQPLTSLAIMLTGAILLAANVVIVHDLTRRLAPDLPGAAPLAAWLVALDYPLIFWTLRGMEVGLAALIIAGALLLALRVTAAGRALDLWLLALVMALGTLTRTDMVIPLGIITAFVVLAGEPRRRWRAGALLGGTLIATLALHTSFRLWYYGDPLPNTYYLKMTGIDLFTRVGRGWATLVFGFVPQRWVLIGFAIGAVALARGRARGHCLLLAAIALGQAMYSVYVGGDAWEWMTYPNRYLTPAMPALLVLGAVALAMLRRAWLANPRRWVARLAPVFLFLFLNGAPYLHWLATGPDHARDDAVMARYGRALAGSTAPEATIAVVWAGALPYFADRPAIDLLGKNDVVIARAAHRPVVGHPTLDATGFIPGHTRWDYEWSIRRGRPDLVAQVFELSDDDRQALASWGYETVVPGVYVRADTSRVDRASLARAATTVPRQLLDTTFRCPVVAETGTRLAQAATTDAGACPDRPAPRRP